MYYVDPIIKDFYRYGQPEGRGTYIRLDQNENPDGIPLWIFEKVIDKLTPEFLSMYPEEIRFIGKYSKAINVESKNVTLTDGSVVAMGYVIRIFGEPSKSLLCVTPTFGMYKVYAEMSGMSVKSVHYNTDFSFDLNDLIDCIDESVGMVSLVNPNMPVGNSYCKADIARVIEKARNVGAMVVVDEAYHYFCDISCIDFIDKYDNVIVLRTFSKMFSMAGLRLGAIISSSQNITYINNYKPHYTVNCMALLVAETIIDNYDAVLYELRNKFITGKEFIISALNDNIYRFVPSDGCFLCIYPKFRTAEYITEKLRERNILIFCGKGDSAGLLRVTVWDKKYMEMFINELLQIDSEDI